jgi:hypothetical protein
VGSCCWRPYRTAPFTGDPGSAPRDASLPVPPGRSVYRVPPFVSHRREKQSISASVKGLRCSSDPESMMVTPNCLFALARDPQRVPMGTSTCSDGPRMANRNPRLIWPISLA